MAQTVNLTVTGMKCGGCETNVVERLTAVEGVISAAAYCKENRVTIEFEPEEVELDDLEDIITDAGFNVE